MSTSKKTQATGMTGSGPLSCGCLKRAPTHTTTTQCSGVQDCGQKSMAIIRGSGGTSSQIRTGTEAILRKVTLVSVSCLHILRRDHLSEVGITDEYGQHGRDHAKLCFTKWTHSTWPWMNRDVSPHVCALPYASDDYRYEAGKWLVTWDTLPTDWNFGTADSVPSSFGPGGRCDMCEL